MICTVTPISNSKQVENYYTRDDYYSRDAKPNDFWQGKLSDRFDLKFAMPTPTLISTEINFTSPSAVQNLTRPFSLMTKKNCKMTLFLGLINFLPTTSFTILKTKSKKINPALFFPITFLNPNALANSNKNFLLPNSFSTSEISLVKNLARLLLTLSPICLRLSTQ